MSRCLGLVVSGAAALLLATPQWALAEPEIRMPVVKLQGLEKVTARVSVIYTRIDQTVTFGTLEITPRTCLETPPTEPPESVAFLEITATDPGQLPEQVYSGWMFASSPSLAALEHPVYDVWVLDCLEAIPDESTDNADTARE